MNNIIKTIVYNPSLVLLINDVISYPQINEDGTYTIVIENMGVRINEKEITNIELVKNETYIATFKVDDFTYEMKIAQLLTLELIRECYD